MANRALKGVLGVILALIMLFSITVPVAGFAPEGAETEDMCSPWADEEIILAQTVYRLGSEGTYSNFRGAASGPKYRQIEESLNSILGTDNKMDFGDGRPTRGQMITALYGFLSDGASTEDAALEFFVDNGLILGRKPDGYQLDETCTVEEMIVFASRLYDYAIYELGNYSAGLFWAAAGASNTVYLLGSIHMSDNSIYPFSKSIEGAFARTANLVVEADIFGITEEETEQVAAMAFIDPSGDETIADYLSEETFDLYVIVCEALGLEPEFYLYIQPWMASNMLSLLLMSDGDVDVLESQAQMGIDMYFLTWAADAGKNIMQLESVLFQLELFANSSLELQEMLLYEMLVSITDPGEPGEAGEAGGMNENEHADLFNALLQAVKDGDEKTVAAFMDMESQGEVDPMIAEFNKSMFYYRDVEMAKKIAGYLQEAEYNGDYFVVVGAGHLVSEKSVIAQLKDMGYAVERILK